MLIFITMLIVNACVAGTIPATPENITVTFLSPTTVRVAWQTMIDLNAHPIEKYIVTYKPSDDRIVQDVAGNSEEIILDRLTPSTQYSIAVTAIWLGKKYRSRQIIFRTLDLPKNSSQQDLPALNYGGPNGVVKSVNAVNVNTEYNNSGAYDNEITSTATNISSQGQQRELPTVRGVEIGIVLMVLMVWAGAIALFFNRWGKIRMLLPYQPDYKHEQLKVPGTGVCSAGVCNGQHSHQHIHILEKERSVSISERCTRSRINSAIFVSSDGNGFDSIEFLRRHGSQSVLCRKARSAENITDNARKKSFSHHNKEQWDAEKCNNENEIENNNNNNSNNISFDNAKNSMQGNVIELHEQRPSTFPVLRTNIEQLANVTTALASSVFKGNLAPVTTSTNNIIVGSVSIEAPPAHIQSEEIPNATGNPLLNESAAAKPRMLVHQTLSNASDYRSQSFSSTPSAHNSPKASLSIKIVKPKIDGLPLVSVSGPSPPADKPPSECL